MICLTLGETQTHTHTHSHTYVYTQTYCGISHLINIPPSTMRWYYYLNSTENAAVTKTPAEKQHAAVL